jgi:hypothetical protein
MKISVHNSVHTLKDTWDFQTVLRSAGETETTQDNIQDWLELDEGDPGFQLLVFLQHLK